MMEKVRSWSWELIQLEMASDQWTEQVTPGAFPAQQMLYQLLLILKKISITSFT